MNFAPYSINFSRSWSSASLHLTISKVNNADEQNAETLIQLWTTNSITSFRSFIRFGLKSESEAQKNASSARFPRYCTKWLLSFRDSEATPAN
jgi:hypothetical protein